MQGIVFNDETTAVANLPRSSRTQENSQPKVSASNNNTIKAVRLVLAVYVIAHHTAGIHVNSVHSPGIHALIEAWTEFSRLNSPAVCGFFILSGYLLTRNGTCDLEPIHCLLRRFTRIFPSFAVAFWVSILIVAPLAGAHNLGDFTSFSSYAARMLLLKEPIVQGTFSGLRWPQINHSLWTMEQLLACYVFTAMAASARVYSNRKFVAIALVIGIFMSLCALSSGGSWRLINLVRCELLALSFIVFRKLSWSKFWVFSAGVILALSGLPGFYQAQILRLFLPYHFPFTIDFHLMSAFCFGVVLSVQREYLSGVRYKEAVALAILMVALITGVQQGVAIVTCGGILLMRLINWQPEWCARSFKIPDLSYGMYLYAWPIMNLLAYNFSSLSLPALFVLNVLFSFLTGYLNYLLIERRLGNRSRAVRFASTA